MRFHCENDSMKFTGKEKFVRKKNITFMQTFSQFISKRKYYSIWNSFNWQLRVRCKCDTTMITRRKYKLVNMVRSLKRTMRHLQPCVSVLNVIFVWNARGSSRILLFFCDESCEKKICYRNCYVCKLYVHNSHILNVNQTSGWKTINTTHSLERHGEYEICCKSCSHSENWWWCANTQKRWASLDARFARFPFVRLIFSHAAA